MRVVSTELKKLFSNKIFLMIVCSVLVMNAYLMFKSTNSKKLMASDYNKIYTEIENKSSDEEKLEYFDTRVNDSASGKYDYNWVVFYELANECYDIVHYKEFLDSIDEQAEAMTKTSLFAKPDTFNYKTIVKTPHAYKNMRDVEPHFDISKGINLALDNSFTDILCGFILLFAVLMLMISDREQGMSGLLFALKRGRSYLFFSKLSALAITIFLAVLLIYSENLIISSYIFGLGNLSRPVQSLNGFIGCNLRINVAEYLVIYILFKFIAIFAIGAVLSLITVMTKNTVSFYGISSVVFITEGILYSLIQPLSIYSIFRYINLISFTKVNEIFCNYKNINFWNYPITLIPVSLTAVILIALICSFLSAYLYSKKRNLEFKRIGLKLNFGNGSKLHSPIYYTLYKSLVQQKGILVIIGIFLISAFLNYSFTKKYDSNDVYYKYYANKIDGEITSEIDNFFASEEQHFIDLETKFNELTNDSNASSKEINEVHKELAPKGGFDLIKERYDKIKNIKNAQLFYDTGYKRIFGKAGYSDDMKYALVTMLMCIFLISPLIANDNKYRMYFVINSTTSGRKKYIRRNVITAAVYGFISAAIWLIGYSVKIYQFYDFSGLNAPIHSITDFINLPINLKVWQYLAVIYVLRIIFVIVSAFIMLFISSKCKNITMAVLINSAVFAMPIIIYLLGADIMVNLGMNPFISVNAVMNWMFS